MQASKQLDWAEFWDGKAASPTDFQATGRSVMSPADFLFSVCEVVRLLAPGPGDRLADIGCGSGLFCLALADRVAKIDAVDISPAMVERARRNVAGVDNVNVTVGKLPRLDLASSAYEKLLGYSVLQYLRDEASVGEAFSDIARVLKPGGHALFACNPDPARRDVYLDAVRRMTPPENMAASLRIMEQTLWVAAEKMTVLAEQAGLRARVLPIHDRIWQHFYMFDFKVEKP